MLRRRRLSIGVTVAIIGIGAMSGLIYPAAASAARKQDPDAAKLTTAVKACKKDTSKTRRKKCEAAAKKKYKVAKAALTIVYTDVRPDGKKVAEHCYTLNCDPASGTLVKPAAACEAIAQDPAWSPQTTQTRFATSQRLRST